MRFTLAVLLLAGALCPVQETSSQGTPKPFQKLLGSWREIPGPDNPALLKVEPEGDSIKFSFGCKQDGSSCPDVIVANYDAKPSKDAGNEYWVASFRKTGERTMQEDGYLNSKQVQTVKWQLSSDGQSLTRTYHTVNPPGSKDRTFASASGKTTEMNPIPLLSRMPPRAIFSRLQRPTESQAKGIVMARITPMRLLAAASRIVANSLVNIRTS